MVFGYYMGKTILITQKAATLYLSLSSATALTSPGLYNLKFHLHHYI